MRDESIRIPPPYQATGSVGADAATGGGGVSGNLYTAHSEAVREAAASSKNYEENVRHHDEPEPEVHHWQDELEQLRALGFSNSTLMLGLLYGAVGSVGAAVGEGKRMSSSRGARAQPPPRNSCFGTSGGCGDWGNNNCDPVCRKGAMIAAGLMMMILFGIRPLFWSVIGVCLIHRARQIGAAPNDSQPHCRRPLKRAAEKFARMAVPMVVFSSVFGCSTLFWTSVTAGVIYGISGVTRSDHSHWE